LKIEDGLFIQFSQFVFERDIQLILIIIHAKIWF